ncbi:hypothetical protein SDC9_201039 [bioreactor metagenome]|uniref:Uncharacterized protein n=1 Tax=bioreactor metagenome TaxID=1076179 RepID=A0A645IPU1_9ZZZZ
MQQAEHGMRAHLAVCHIGRGGECHQAAVTPYRVGQAFAQIQREQRAVARHGLQPRGLHVLQAAQHACQRAGEVCVRIAIAPHRHPPALVDVQMAVGADGHVAYLRLQAFERATGKRLPHERLQTLVHPTKARAAPSGKHEPGDFLDGDGGDWLVVAVVAG